MSACIIRFIRNVPDPFRRDCFERYASAVAANVDWNEDTKKRTKSLFSLVEKAQEKDLAPLVSAVDRLDDMDSEIGQAAIITVFAEDVSLILKLPNSMTRSCWALLQDADKFLRAESVAYADSGRDNRRLYSGFHVPSGIHPSKDAETLRAFEDEIAKMVGNGRKIKVDRFQRERGNKQGNKVTVSHYTIYYEDLPQTATVFKDDNIEQQPITPVQDAALVYDTATGMIDVLCEMKEIRHQIARAFVSTVLKSDLNAEAIPLREYNLDCLLNSLSFPTDPEDLIDSVKVSKLRLRDIARNNRIEISLAADESLTIYDYCKSKFGSADPTQRGFFATLACITIRKHPKQGHKRGKSIHVRLTYPNGCDLSGRPDAERLMIEKYLARWGLIRAV